MKTLELAKELKISNKVQDNNGFIFDVVSIFKDSTVYCDFKGNEGDVCKFDTNNPCQGIPLTEEILLKCGFILKGIIFRINNGSSHQFDINYSPSKDMFYYESSSYSILRQFEVKYLHQMQNLYFALTGKELNFE